MCILSFNSHFNSSNLLKLQVLQIRKSTLSELRESVKILQGGLITQGICARMGPLLDGRILMLFEMGDYVVYPGHGVGIIADIAKQEVEGTTLSFYKVKVISNGMMVMVPTNSDQGIRKLAGANEVKNIYDILNDHNVTVDRSTWNRRYREYMAKVKTGSLLEIAEVLRELFLLKREKALSYGEKKMLDQCKDLIAQEISISDQEELSIVKTKIDSCFEQEAKL